MKVAFSTGRPAHIVLPANLLAKGGIDVTIYTAAYRSRFRGLASNIRLRWVPQVVPSFHFLTGVQLPRPLQRADTAIYDRVVGLRIEPCELFWGWATGALAAGRAARRLGARFVLDRACPHVDVQQALIQAESEQLGVPYHPEPRWFRERQLAEYAEADIILVPSEYSRRSFPPNLQTKILVAPLSGRVPRPQPDKRMPAATNAEQVFTFGTVGGQPLRKGFLYLLRAWQQLKLPNARLLLRTDAPLADFPALRKLLLELKNVEVVGYVENMNIFYRRCDAFVFPTLDDGFGMALMEAMANGVPSITTNHCGAAEMFAAGKDLMVVPARDVEQLEEAMRRLYESRETRDQLRKNALVALEQMGEGEAFSPYAKTMKQILRTVNVFS